MKNIITIFVFFVLTILFASSAYAQFTIPMPVPDTSCQDRIPKPIDSPSGWCQYWRSLDNCGYIPIEVNLSGDDCTVNTDIGMNGIQHYYYFENQFCIEQIGGSWPSKKCLTRTDIVQPTTIPKLDPAPGFQPLLEKSETQLEVEQKSKQRAQEIKQMNQKIDDMVRQQTEKDAANSQINQLQTFNDALNKLINNLGTYTVKIKDWAGRIFDGAKNLFKK